MFRNLRRRLTDDDVLEFTIEAEQRTGPKTRDQIIERVYLANPVRWRRLQRDYKWLQRQMKKQGLNPDEARELL